MLTRRHGLVPACFTIGLLAFTLPLLADTPAAPFVSATGAQIIVLQNVVPGGVMRIAHWDSPPQLPVGVSQIVSVPVQNALLVTATPAGLAKVREIVKLVDIAPRQVQIKFALAYVSDADIKAASLIPDQDATGLPATKLLQVLTKQKAIVASTTLTTANYVYASLSFSYGPATPLTFGVTPRVNSDNSLTLALDAAVPGVSVKHEAHTIQNGDTLAIVKPPASSGAAEKSMVLFVTATVK